MPNLSSNVEQAKAAYRYYVKGDRSIAFDPASRSWVPVAGTSRGDDAGDGSGLSQRALSRISGVQDAERRGFISHDAAEAEILQIIREET